MDDPMKYALDFLDKLKKRKIPLVWQKTTRVNTSGVTAFESMTSNCALTVALSDAGGQKYIEGVAFIAGTGTVIRIPPDIAEPLWLEAREAVEGVSKEPVRVFLPDLKRPKEDLLVDLSEKDKTEARKHFQELESLGVPIAVFKRILTETFNMGLRYGAKLGSKDT